MTDKLTQCKMTNLKLITKFLFTNVAYPFIAGSVIPFGTSHHPGSINLDTILSPTTVIWLTSIPIIETKGSAIVPFETIAVSLSSNPCSVNGRWILKASNECHFMLGMN